VSRLRAKCPDCGTYTAVALGVDYQCHACGREFSAGLVRVPRAWGEGGESMEDAARTLALPWPEAAVVEEESLGEQNLALAADLPERPLVLGGCCCSHIGAVEGLVARHGRTAVVWVDAHGDLNTPETSPSGNAWGMPLRMLIDSGTVRPEDVALVGARSLDPPEEEFIAASGVRVGAPEAVGLVGEARRVYVALDCDSLEAGEVVPFMPEPDGLSVNEVVELFEDLRARGRVVGAGLSAFMPDTRNVEPMTRLCSALGL
jgi:arginase